ncbi:MAG: AraC family transcriptional regulator [Lachnospiraceae bacterium]
MQIRGTKLICFAHTKLREVLTIKNYTYEIFEQANIYINYNEVRKTTMHSHDFIEIAYISQGEGTHIIENREVSCKAGEYYVIDIHTEHQFIAKTEKLVIYNCIFTADFVENGLARDIGFNGMIRQYPWNQYVTCSYQPSYQSFLITPKLHWIFTEMLEEYTKRNAGYLQMLYSYVVQLLLYTLRMTPKEESGDLILPSQMLGKVIEYIYRNYNQNITLAELQNLTFFSGSHLCRKFKKETGKTIKEFIRTIRLNESKKMLIHTELQVKEISRKIGYDDVKYFTDIFKKEIGKTPTMYRKDYR